MTKPRFSLRFLLIAITLAAAYLAASQAHRRQLKQSLARFEEQGVSFAYDDRWSDKIWLRMPAKATIPIYVSDNQAIASILFSDGRGSDYLISKLTKELKDIGVADVTTTVIRQ